ncbi:MAG: DUF4304 domain-containing protein [Cyclobacteriaceae bacterium]|nr:DUF4304 domain-containing protein [Cyclobacteriaceae bacterium]
MSNKEFKDTLDKVLKPHGFKKKGNEWTMETIELLKVIDLQKSNFSNLYYLNYGYNFKGFDYDGTTYHIFSRLGSIDKEINTVIQATFDLETPMDDLTRGRNLSDLVNSVLLKEMNSTNSKDDILNLLKTRQTLNDISFRVKQYLNIELE